MPKKSYILKLIFIMIIATLLLFIGSIFLYVGVNVHAMNESKQQLTEMQEIVARESAGAATTQEADSSQVLPEYISLHEQNPDLSGWLTIDGTDIDYPVMQLDGDNNFYLSHNFAGQEDQNGLLVLDYRCSDAGNYLIHGHNMKSGMMFGSLSEYERKSYWQQHQRIQFHTLYERGEYEIVSVFRSQVYENGADVFKFYDCLNTSDYETFNYFTENISEMALYDTGVTPLPGDRFLMLSTCDYSVKNGRLVVVARKVN